jgi:hypothetical protein
MLVLISSKQVILHLAIEMLVMVEDLRRLEVEGKE